MSSRVAAAFAACLFTLSGCGVIYTSPEVRDGSVFGDAPDTDYRVEVIPLTYETAAAANLEGYVPQRLPAAFQPGAASRLMANRELGATPTPSLVGLPGVTAPPTSRPGFIPDRLPPRVEPEPYEIGVADVLLLAVSTPATLENLPALVEATSKRQGYVVQDDGMIAIPDVGRVRVGGLTVREAEDAIFEAVAAAGIDPSFTLEIAEFNSKNVAVGGLVNQPTLVPIALQSLDLGEAIQLAGGIAPVDPEVTKILIFRDGERYQLSVDRYLRDADLRDITLRADDTVFVVSDFREEQAEQRFAELLQLRQQQMATTQFQLELQRLSNQLQETERSFLADEREAFLDRVELGAVPREHVYLAGEVFQMRRVPLPFESHATLADVLMDDQRLQIETADYEEIYVLRGLLAPGQFGVVRAYHLDASNAVNLVSATAFQMRPNDVVFVAEQPVTAWNRAISQTLPNLFTQVARTATAGL